MAVEIIVPFTFEAVVSEVGTRKKARVVMTDAVPAQIAVADGRDVPIVAHMKREVVVQAARLPAQREKRRHCAVDIRYAGGNFYQPIPFPREGGVSKLTIAGYLDIQETRPRSLLHHAWPNLEHIAARAGKPLQAGDPSVMVHSSTQQACRERAIEEAQNYVFIEDVLYRPGSQPVYVQLADGSMVSRFQSEAQEKRIESHRIWAATDDTALFEHLSSLPDERQDMVFENSAIEILDATPFTFDRAKAIAQTGADMTLRAVSRHLLQAPDQVVHRWLDLRSMTSDDNCSAEDIVHHACHLLNDASGLGLTQSSIADIGNYLGRVHAGEIQNGGGHSPGFETDITPCSSR